MRTNSDATNAVVPLGWLRHLAMLLGVVALVIGASVFDATAQNPLYSSTPDLTDGVDGEVFVVEVIGDEIWVGGDFDFSRPPQFASPQVPRKNLAVFDLNSGELLARRLDTNGAVHAIESDGKTVWIGGEFTTVAGTQQSRIAAFDLLTETFIADFATAHSGVVRDIHLHDGALYVGGLFQGFNSTGKRNAVRIDPLTGTVFAGFSPNPNAMVRTIDAIGTEIVLGGTFTRIGPDYERENEAYVAGVHADTGVELGTDYDNSVGGVFGIDRDEVDVVRVSGDGRFVYVGDEVNTVVKYRRSDGKVMWWTRGKGNIQALAERDGVMYVGLHDGWDDEGDGRMLVAIDTADGDVIDSFNTEMNSFWGVRDLEATDQGLIAVGDFTNVVGLNARRIAIFRPLGGFQPAPPLVVPTSTPVPVASPTPTATAVPTPTPTPGPTPSPTPTPTPTPLPPTPTPEPVVPTLLEAQVRPAGEVLVRWAQTTNADQYDIGVRPSVGAQWQVVSTVDAAADADSQGFVLRATDQWAPPSGSTFELAVRSVTNAVVGAYSTPVAVRLDVERRELRQSGQSAAAVTVVWESVDPADAFERYEVFLGELEDDIVNCRVGTISGRAVTSLTITRLPDQCGGTPLTSATAYVAGLRVVQTGAVVAASSAVEVITTTTSGGTPIPDEAYEVREINGTWQIAHTGGSATQWNAINVRRGELNSYAYALGELQDLKARGFDTVRLVMDWSRFQRDPDSFHEPSFDALDRFISWATAADMGVILDPLHLADGPAWQVPDWAWQYTTGGAYSDEQVLSAIRDNAAPYLQHVAHRYVGTDAVVAIDLVNEPREPLIGSLSNRNQILVSLYHDLIVAVRDVDDDIPLILEPFYGSARMDGETLSAIAAPTLSDPSPDASDFDNLIWSIHDYYVGRQGTGDDDGYGSLGYAKRGVASDGTRLRTEAWDQTSCYPAGATAESCTSDVSRIDVTIPSMRRHVLVHHDAAQIAGMALFVGEYGVPHAALDKLGWSGGEQLLADKLAIYEELGISRAWWAWRTDVDPTFGVYQRAFGIWHPWMDFFDDRPLIAASMLCQSNGSVVEVMFFNDTGGQANYTSTVSGTAISTTVAAGAIGTAVHPAPAGSTPTVTVSRSGAVLFSATPSGECADSAGTDVPIEVMHTKSCLAGNGRFDTNIVNTGTEPATYRIEFEGLSARQLSVEPGDWWRMPITGRPDREFSVVVKRDGAVVSSSSVTFTCDLAQPDLDDDEIRIVNSCRAGNGYLIFQFVNSSTASKSYVIEFEGVRNRSTTAAAFGQAVRAVTGRPDGTWGVVIRSGGQPIAQMDVTVDCDG